MCWSASSPPGSTAEPAPHDRPAVPHADPWIWVPLPEDPVPGTNVAGLVEAVGKNVTRFRVGDEVYGTCRGAFAEYARASPDKLASKPNSLRFEQAAVVPYGGLAAWQAVHDRGRVEAGQ